MPLQVFQAPGGNGAKTAPVRRSVPNIPAVPGIQATSAEVLFKGHLYDYSGYAIAARNLLFRMGNTVRTSLGSNSSVLVGGPVEQYDWNRLDFFRNVPVSPQAPLLWFFTVQPQYEKRYKICYTMFETETLYPTYVKTINKNFHECWVPTEWNKEVFKRNKVKLPMRVMPLGTNPQIFRPVEGCDLPKCFLVSTDRAGIYERPKGFRFLSIFHPCHRKGIDLMFRAFEEAFGSDKDVCLVLGIGSYEPDKLSEIFEKPLKKYIKKAKVYLLPAPLPETELVKVYNSCHAYLCTSRGEGWNLPATEAASCGLPLILPKNSAHLDWVSGDHVFFVEPEGLENWQYAGSHVHRNWYAGQKVSKFGKKSFEQLLSHLDFIKNNPAKAKRKAKKMIDLVRNEYTWDRMAARVCDRIIELNQ